MSRSSRQPMDFEQWSQLACQDPAGFEAMRREMIETMIEASAERCQQRLRGLQWRVDQIREHSPNPMAACIELSNMMWQAFAGEEGLTEALNRQTRPKPRERKKAEVLPFPGSRE